MTISKEIKEEILNIIKVMVILSIIIGAWVTIAWIAHQDNLRSFIVEEEAVEDITHQLKSLYGDGTEVVYFSDTSPENDIFALSAKYKIVDVIVDYKKSNEDIWQRIIYTCERPVEKRQYCYEKQYITVE